ncbi:mechanosensitive ion channel family protein [Leisingera sp. McT4-56]|uniref:mechanosensitive ion channel family protein n=1 Tax=Leisingera sp. McT4-56 TaxID=2881255 RepID=UPI001CF8DA82|nr:mechanosensitive ion channel family protein [Leisingera sp. McT4-56]MCB4454058.1 mechanosensitive ion channel family protein [Leisingera sp. McT4-56]
MKSFFHRFARIFGIVLTVVLLGTAWQAPARAQTTEAPALPDPLTEEAIHEMVARMSDDQVRALLLERLDAVAARQEAEAQPATLTGRAVQLWTAFTLPVTDAVRKLPVLPEGQSRAIGNFVQKHGGLGGVLTMFGLIALTLAIGLAAEYAVRQLIARWRNLEVVSGDADTLAGALSFLGRRFLREMVGLVVFYVVIRAVGRTLLDAQMLQFAAPMVTYLIWLPRVGAAASRFIMAPERPDRRLVNASDRWADFLHLHTIGLIFLAGLAIFSVRFNTANGVPPESIRLAYWLDSLVYVYIIWIAWTAREGLTDMMRGTDPDRTRYDEVAAHYYPYFAMAVAALTWVAVGTLVGLGKVAQLIHGAHYITMFWLLAAPALDTAIRGLVKHLVPPMSGEGQLAAEAYKSTKRSYIRIGRVLVAGIVLMIISNAWDVDLMAIASGAEGIAGNIIGCLMTIAVGYVVYEGVSLWINRRLAKEQTSGEEGEVGGEGGGAGGSRLATVLPLLLVTAQIAIVVIFGLLAVGALGIDITPLLAGAGILGLAIGFGAQKLVSDVVSGIFFLVDDAFRVGEYVEVEGTRGTVEKISIRSMQLRHHRGPINTIPYGEIPKLTNYSRDWVIMKLRFTVPFDTDPNKVKKIFKKIGASMLEDELYKDDFLQPFKSQGVFDFDDVGMIIRGKFMAKPGTQFTIRKEIYNRVKAAFAENGIDFARREVRVAIPGLEDTDQLNDTEKAAIAAAAGSAAQQQAAEEAEDGAGQKK